MTRDYLTPRYVIFGKQKGGCFVLFNIDSEKQSSFILPPVFQDDKDELKWCWSNIILLEQADEYGMLFHNKDTGFLEYAVYNQDTNVAPRFFKPEDQCFTHYDVSIKGKNYFVLRKEDNTFAIRSSEDFSASFAEYSGHLPPSNEISFNRFTADGLFIKSYLWPRRVQVWDYRKDQMVSTFIGSSAFFTYPEIDSSGELGIFLTPVDLLLPQNEIDTIRSIQVRNLRTGKILAQCFGDFDGAKFSPANSSTILLWNHDSGTAILWEYSTQENEPGKIIFRLDVPVAASKADDDYGRYIFGTFSSDGKRIVFITDDLKIYVYSADTGKLMRTSKIEFPAHSSEDLKSKQTRNGKQKLKRFLRNDKTRK